MTAAPGAPRAQLLADNPTRNAQEVIDDIERLLRGVGDDAPLLCLVMSLSDFALLRGLAGKPGVNLIRDYPAVVKALKMHVTLHVEYKGPPRITGTLGTESHDAHADQARRDALIKAYDWRETDERIRRGAQGTPLG